jgi:hypothetical protein
MTTTPVLQDAKKLSELLGLLKGVDSVELKLTVPDSLRRSALRALGIDPLDAQLRQVLFFDTPDLKLNQAGVVVRARRVKAGDDCVVKLRPVVPENLPKKLRESPDVNVEVDVLPGAFVCSASFKAKLGVGAVREVVDKAPLRRLFTKQQRAFYTAHAPEGILLDDLTLLGPINILKLKFASKQFSRPLVVEAWLYPDGSNIVELSTKCPPAQAFEVAAEARAFLGTRGIDLSGEQATKTAKALAFFSSELADSAG